MRCSTQEVRVDCRWAAIYYPVMIIAMRPRRLALGFGFVLALVLTFAACSSSGGSSEQDEGNLFPNGGFEEGRDPWFSLKPPDFISSQELAHSGQTSALLRMRDPPETNDVKVYYLVQEITPDELPEVVSGWYRVEHWLKGTPKQYLQFVVIALGADNLPGDYTNYQIRYLLAGIEDPPFFIQNAHFVFIDKEEPALGEWVYFERNLREDFERLWGAAPQNFEKLRILFEVRWDDKMPGSPAEADVYYDDLYIGPAR